MQRVCYARSTFAMLWHNYLVVLSDFMVSLPLPLPRELLSVSLPAEVGEPLSLSDTQPESMPVRGSPPESSDEPPESSDVPLESSGEPLESSAGPPVSPEDLTESPDVVTRDESEVPQDSLASSTEVLPSVIAFSLWRE